jgi:hypothetical protein
MSVQEADGMPILEFDYKGQDLVALAGEECYSSHLGSLTHLGTNILVSDWLGGTWAPGQGISIHHPSNVSLANATLYVMVFEPAGMTQIPEYDAFPAMLCVVCLAVLLCRRDGRSRFGWLWRETEGTPH